MVDATAGIYNQFGLANRVLHHKLLFSFLQNNETLLPLHTFGLKRYRGRVVRLSSAKAATAVRPRSGPHIKGN